MKSLPVLPKKKKERKKILENDEKIPKKGFCTEFKVEWVLPRHFQHQDSWALQGPKGRHTT
jgi:hypothetical protein